MMLTINIDRKSWAKRNLRESRVDLMIAEKIRSPYVESELAISAMRKAQMAIYYLLGDPYVIGPKIYQFVAENRPAQDPLLRFLMALERRISFRMATIASAPKEELIREANFFIDTASEILSLTERV
jgi:hypothetical protein